MRWHRHGLTASGAVAALAIGGGAAPATSRQPSTFW